MSETTPEANNHGPAPVQMSPEQAASLGLTPTPEGAAPALIPADQVKPEDIGKLSIEYRDGQPVIVVSGGRYVPAQLSILDEAGAPLAADTKAKPLFAIAGEVGTSHDLWGPYR
ncbi:hypothetical protein [Streptomyces sp. NPDC001205]